MSLRYQRSALSVVVATLFTSVSFSSFAAPVTADTILAQKIAQQKVILRNLVVLVV